MKLEENHEMPFLDGQIKRNLKLSQQQNIANQFLLASTPSGTLSLLESIQSI